jgi:HlyD family type I secretion membrane fusion protein
MNKRVNMNENIEQINQAPIDMRPYAKVGYLLMMITLVIFAIWGIYARLDSGAIASGEVIPSDKVLTVQHKEGGVIHKIFVKDGQTVKKGDPLLELESISDSSEFQIEQIDRNSLQALAARLEAEREGKSVNPYAKNLASNNLEYQIFLSRKEGLERDTEILEKRIEQITNEIKGNEFEIESLETILASSQETLAMNKELYKNRFLDKRKLLDSQNLVADTEGRIGKKRSDIFQAREKITETKLQIIRLKNQWRNDVLEQLKKVKDALKVTNEKIKITSDKLDRSIVEAPAEGKIHGIKFNTIGGVIKPGDEILEIVPQEEKLVIEVKVMPDDIDSVHVGLNAFIRITAYKQRTHNAVKGKVMEISPNTFKDPNTNTSYYKAKIEINQKELTNEQKIVLQPGMLAQVEIVTGERTPLEYLIQPFVDSFQKSFKEE